MSLSPEIPTESIHTLTTKEKRSLLRRLNSIRKKTHQAVLQEIKDTRKYPLPVLVELVKLERKHTRLMLGISFKGYLVCSFMGMVIVQGFISRLLWMIASLLFTLPSLDLGGKRPIRSIIEVMAHHKDKQVLPYLLEHGLEHGVMKDIPPDWKPLLIQLLSELRTQDVNLLQESHRAKLNEYLLREIGYSLAIKMAILKAYQQVGDVSALTTVEKLIEQKKRYSSKSAVALCQAAKECLPYLQQNVGRVTEIQTLLRASSPNEKQEELLRPLQAEKPEEDSLLLRASEKTPN